MSALIAGSLIVASLAGPVLTERDTYVSPNERYAQSIAESREKRERVSQRYSLNKPKQYWIDVESMSQNRDTPDSPPPPPIALRQSTDVPPTTSRNGAGDSADMAWVMGVIERYGLDTTGTNWTISDKGRCGPAKAGKWAGCTRMSSPADIRINPVVIGTDYGVHVVVHEWVHGKLRIKDECATEARTHQITGRPDLRGYDC